MPVGWITAKVIAAINAGFNEVIIPDSNFGDLVLTEEQKSKIKIIPVKTLNQVLENAFEKSAKKQKFIKSLEKIMHFDFAKVIDKNFKKIVG